MSGLTTGRTGKPSSVVISSWSKRVFPARSPRCNCASAIEISDSGAAAGALRSSLLPPKPNQPLDLWRWKVRRAGIEVVMGPSEGRPAHRSATRAFMAGIGGGGCLNQMIFRG